MRFSRFRQQMEGVSSAPRKPRSAVAHSKKTKRDKPKPRREKVPKQEIERVTKTEPREDLGPVPEVDETEQVIKPEPVEETERMLDVEEPIIHPAAFVKNEPMDEGFGGRGNTEWVPFQPYQYPAYQGNEAGYPSSQHLRIKEEPKVKMEPDWTGRM